MKFTKTLAVSAVVACVITTSAFAANISAQNDSAAGGAKNSGNSWGVHGNMDRKGFRGHGRGDFGPIKFNPFDSLVKAGTITQAQADAIQSAMKTGRESKKSMKDVLDGLVSAGTITQDQENAIVKSFPAREGKGGSDRRHGNPMDSLVTTGTMTQAQADAVHSAFRSAMESQKSFKDALDSLVSAGTITQAQADAIQNAMKPPAADSSNKAQ